MDIVLLLILSPIVFVITLVNLLAWATGLTLMINIYKSGKHPEVDSSNYPGRFLGFIQMSRHIPKLMKLAFTYVVTGDGKHPILTGMEPGRYQIHSLEGLGGPIVVKITRPMLNMNRQDLMEQLDFRPDDGEVT